MSWQIKVLERAENDQHTLFAEWQDTIWGGGWPSGRSVKDESAWSPPAYDINSIEEAQKFVGGYLARNYPEDTFTVVWEHGDRRERRFQLVS